MTQTLQRPKIISAQVSATLAHDLERLAAEQDRSVSSLVRLAVREHLERLNDSKGA